MVAVFEVVDRAASWLDLRQSELSPVACETEPEGILEMIMPFEGLMGRGPQKWVLFLGYWVA